MSLHTAACTAEREREEIVLVHRKYDWKERGRGCACLPVPSYTLVICPRRADPATRRDYGIKKGAEHRTMQQTCLSTKVKKNKNKKIKKITKHARPS